MTTVADHAKLKTLLCQRAQELGIDRIGFCAATGFPEQDAWLETARQEERTCGLEPASRTPSSRLPNARSFIVIAVNYFQPLPPPPTAPAGRISRSALGQDYHAWVTSLLNALAKPLEEGGAHWVCGTDNWPFPERELARRAGLGHIGKNGSLIVPRLGSWVFIGAILCDIELPPDAPLEGNPCAGCDRCQQACPTGAIDSARRFNARRCISFLTQCKQDIPAELREKMGRAIYGCDCCQEVCPLNREAPVMLTATEESLPPYPLLETLFHTTRQDLPATWEKSAAFWRGLHILRRNAMIAAHNTAPGLAKTLLAEALNDSSPLVRDTALTILAGR
jgi:epoxyqueuosine reductase